VRAALGAVLGTELLLTGEVRYGRRHRTGGALGALDGGLGMGKEQIAGK
jgi:hypothetical protein